MSERTMTTRAGERLLNLHEVGEALGKLNVSDVRVLIRTGKLAAKQRIVRGTGDKPHLFVLASEVERYIRDLADYVPKGQPSHAGKGGQRRAPRRGKLSDVIEFV